MPTLTAIDVIGIQDYIFASNMMRDVIAASHLVDWATSAGIDGALRSLGNGAPDPRVIVAAGGNAILEFDDQNAAKTYIRHYTRALVETTPGLDVAVAHVDCQPGQLARGLLALQIRLAEAKLSRHPHAPQLGLSVMQPCAATGLPAGVQLSREQSHLSTQIAAIRASDVRDTVRRRWQEYIPSPEDMPPEVRRRNVALEFPEELNRMGRSTGELSQIGVVHVDGNSFGNRIHRWLCQHLQQKTNDDVIKQQHQLWSTALREVGERVLKSLVSRIVGRLEVRQETDGQHQRIYVAGRSGPDNELDFRLFDKTEDRRQTVFLPIRPILLGGDDLTFVCDGRIALDLAAFALREFNRVAGEIEDLKILGDAPLTACAGVMIDRAHAPFDRTYAFSEQLCASAKAARKLAMRGGDSDGAWMDWHIGSVRPGESLEQMREREYRSSAGELTMRPYVLTADISNQICWDWLESELLGPPRGGRGTRSFRHPDSWGTRRNKVKALGELVRHGANTVKDQLSAWQIVDKNLQLPEPIERDGFTSGKTPLLDAVELLDMHLILEPPATGDLSNAHMAQEASA